MPKENSQNRSRIKIEKKMQKNTSGNLRFDQSETSQKNSVITSLKKELF